MNIDCITEYVLNFVRTITAVEDNACVVVRPGCNYPSGHQCIISLQGHILEICGVQLTARTPSIMRLLIVFSVPHAGLKP